MLSNLGPAVAIRPALQGAHIDGARHCRHGLRTLAQQQPHQQPRRQRGPAAAAAAAGAADEGATADDEQRLEDLNIFQPPKLEEEQEQRLRMQYERGNCYGCGVRLQLQDPEVAGFVGQDKYDVKLRHRQLGQLLCFRCQELSNGAMIPAVSDFAQRELGQGQAVRQQQQQQQQEQQAVGLAGEPAEAGWAQQGAGAGPQQAQQRHTGFTDKVLLTPEELREKLKVVQQQKAVVVLLVDLLDASGSILGRVRDLIGNNPIILVGTKADLLPPGTNYADVAEWLQAAAGFKRITAVSVHLVSAKSGAGVPAAVAAIRRERRGRDVFVMGAANVGKSAFIRSFVRDMSKMGSRQFDPMAQTRGRFLPVESAMPGTTLELIPMEVFAAGGMLFDTPGLHLHHRVPHLLTPAENKLLHPRRKLRPYVPPSPAELLEVTKAGCSIVPAGSADVSAGADATSAPATSSHSCQVPTYWWGGLAKIQVLGCPPDTEFVFYGPQALLVEASVEPADGLVDDTSAATTGTSPNSAGEGQAEAMAVAVPVEAAAAAAEEPHGFGAASVIRRGGLRPAKELTLKCGEGGGSGAARRPLADIAVSGIPGWIAVFTNGARGEAVQVRVWTPPGIEVYSRPPLPVPCPLAPAEATWASAGAGQQPAGAGMAAAAVAPPPPKPQSAGWGGEEKAAPAAAAAADWWAEAGEARVPAATGGWAEEEAVPAAPAAVPAAVPAAAAEAAAGGWEEARQEAPAASGWGEARTPASVPASSSRRERPQKQQQQQKQPDSSAVDDWW